MTEGDQSQHELLDYSERDAKSCFYSIVILYVRDLGFSLIAAGVAELILGDSGTRGGR